MKKTAVIYWSGTGNTKQMAEAVLEGMKSAGAEAALLEAAQVDASTFSGVDAVAFGCPAMGSEVLEEMEFEPMFSACKSHLSGKKVALFGSYGWGDGEWMRSPSSPSIISCRPFRSGAGAAGQPASSRSSGYGSSSGDTRRHTRRQLS